MNLTYIILIVIIFVSCSKEPELPVLSGGRDLKITGALLQYYSDNTPSDIKRFVVYPISQTDTLLLDTNSSYTAQLFLWSGSDTLNAIIKQDAVFYDFQYRVFSNDISHFTIGILDKDAQENSLGLQSKWNIGQAVSDSVTLSISGFFYKEHTKNFGVRSDSLFQTQISVKLGY